MKKLIILGLFSLLSNHLFSQYPSVSTNINGDTIYCFTPLQTDSVIRTFERYKFSVKRISIIENELDICTGQITSLLNENNHLISSSKQDSVSLVIQKRKFTECEGMNEFYRGEIEKKDRTIKWLSYGLGVAVVVAVTFLATN